MQRVQVYIGSERLELFKDETISITQSIQNIKDISKVFTSFTQTFSVPASPNNNKIFKHYYNYNITNGFDARQKSSASIELNFIPWKKGFIALNGVNLKENKPHAYRITFYGETINFKDIVGEDLLSNLLPLSVFNLNYDATTIKDKLEGSLDNATAKINGAITNSTALVVDNNSGTIAVGDVINCEGVNGLVTITTVTNQNNLVMSSAQTIADDVDITFSKSICAPLITHTKRLYYNSVSPAAESGNLFYSSSLQTQGVEFSDLKYALRVDRIIQAIESHYTTDNGFASNIVFSDDFFGTEDLNYFNLFLWLHRKKGNVAPTTQTTEYLTQVSGFSASGSTNTGLNAEGNTITIFTLNIAPPNFIDKNSLLLTTSTSEKFQVYIYRNGALFYASEEIQGTGSSVNTLLSETEFGILTPANYTVSIRQLNQTNITFSTIRWDIDGEQSGSVYNDIYTSSSFSTDTFNTEFNIVEQIPEMKVIDFLTGVMKMFNLTAYVENDIIIVKKLDEYYRLESTWETTTTIWQNDDTLWNEAGTSGSSIYSLDEYLDVNSTQVNVALPFKQVDFEYEGLGTFLAQQYKQLNNIGWGTERFTLDSDTYDAPNKVYKVKLPFEHVQYERLLNGVTNTTVQFGYFVDSNQQPYFGKPLLFYPIRQSVSAAVNEQISFRTTSSANTNLTNYIVPSNSVSLSSSTDTSNINFGLEINEFQLDGSFTGTLFKTYYESYISEIFNKKRRFYKVTAYLPMSLIYNLQLYDTVEVNFENYRINTITTNLANGKSNIELINVV